LRKRRTRQSKRRHTGFQGEVGEAVKKREWVNDSSCGGAISISEEGGYEGIGIAQEGSIRRR